MGEAAHVCLSGLDVSGLDVRGANKRGGVGGEGEGDIVFNARVYFPKIWHLFWAQMGAPNGTTPLGEPMNQASASRRGTDLLKWHLDY